jgi:predicted alpha/beta-hydrolase family hydrolase
LRNPDEIEIVATPGGATTALVYPADHDPIGAVLVLGHGAGAGQRSPWMVDCARSLSSAGLDIVTFNFFYTAQGRKVPDRRPALEACYRAVIDTVRQRLDDAQRALFIGGKSMGGRIATQVAADDQDLNLNGLVLLGYPLHPPGKPAERRDAHLSSVARPMLFVQGSRDAFGTPVELTPVLEALSPAADLHVVEGGDHSFKIGRKDPVRQQALFSDVYRTIAGWIRART